MADPPAARRMLAFAAVTVLAACAATGGADQPARLLHVYDGDTVLVQIAGGAREKIRLLGVDAPEIEGYHHAEPGGEAAKERARTLLADGALQLETDATADVRDVYGRLLRYVRLPDGRDLGGTLIEEGYARAFRRFTYRRKQDYLAYEAAARSAGRGLWAGGGKAP